MARAPVVAAGGIVLRHGVTPLVAVVHQRKRDEWVLPKGKLDVGETVREAAIREVLEETGHVVATHEFLGMLAYQSGGGSKFVHFWRMEADGEPAGKLMKDVKAVVWLPLEEAIERLSREYERAFLAQVGPIALEAVAIRQAEKQAEPETIPPAEHEAMRELAAEDVEAAMEPLSPAEAASGEQLRIGLLQKLKAWLRGGA